MAQKAQGKNGAAKELVARRLGIFLRQHADVAVELRSDGKEGYLYRPRQLLVDAKEVNKNDVRRLLEELGACEVDRWGDTARCQPDARPGRRPPRTKSEDLSPIGLAVRYLPPSVSIPSLVAYLQSQSFRRSGPWPECGVNHVFAGVQAYTGDPADDPTPAKALPPSGYHSEAAGHGVSVGILDTGIDSLAAQHPSLSGHFLIEPGDVDFLDGDGSGKLDRQAGHGTFVAGVLMQRAPKATFDPQAVLSTDGLGDDATISLALEAMLKHHQIVNMSLGGYTAGDVVPIGLNRVLDNLQRASLVIAAAGNNSSDQPYWPAADERVLAVAAVDKNGRRAKFSNFGDWVDACALGQKVTSTFVKGDWDPASLHPPATAAPIFVEPYATWSGTSFAAPLVAGAIADRMSDEPGLTARDAAKKVLDEADPGPTGCGQRIK